MGNWECPCTWLICVYVLRVSRDLIEMRRMMSVRRRSRAVALVISAVVGIYLVYDAVLLSRNSEFQHTGKLV